MEIKKKVDVEFILRHRASVDVNKQWKKKLRLLYLLCAPLVVYVVCMMSIYPKAGVEYSMPKDVAWGFIVLFIWTLLCFFLIATCYEREKEVLRKKYLDDEIKKGGVEDA